MTELFDMGICGSFTFYYQCVHNSREKYRICVEFARAKVSQHLYVLQTLAEVFMHL